VRLAAAATTGGRGDVFDQRVRANAAVPEIVRHDDEQRVLSILEARAEHADARAELLAHGVAKRLELLDVAGVYDAKEGGGFVPGGASLHNCMSGHGPDAGSYEKAVASDTSKPLHIVDTMAFMFETRAVIRPTKQALEAKELQGDYYECWQGIKKHFDPKRR